MVELRDGLFIASRIDAEMGLLAQVIDLESGSVVAALPTDDSQGTQILRGRMTHGGE